MPDAKKILNDWIPLLGFGALFAFFRIYNLGHGIGTHPDERHMIMVAEGLSLSDMNPHSFAYGSFPYYLLWLTSRILSIFSQFYTSYDGLFWVGRGICVASGLLGILLIFKLAQSLFDDELTSGLAALLLGLNVFHIQLSRFYTVDVVMTTLCTAALLVILKIARGGGWKAHVCCGVILGLAVASKITAFFLLAPLGIAWIVARVRARKILSLRAFGLAALVAVAAIVTFCSVEPYAILDYPRFLADSREQTSMVRGEWRPPYTIQFAHTTKYLYHLRQFIFTMGWPIAVLAIVGTIVAAVRALRRPRGEEIVALAYVLPMFFLVAGMQVKFPRYLLPLYPVLLVYAAHLLSTSMRRLEIPVAGFATPEWAAPGASSAIRSYDAKESALSKFLGRAASKAVNIIRTRLGVVIGLVLAAVVAVMGVKLYRITRAQLYPGVFVGGIGTSDGNFKDMMAIAVAKNGDIFAVDMYNSRVQRFNSRGGFVLSWGSNGADVGQFNEPRGIALDNNDNVYVVDSWNGRVQQFDTSGKFVQQFVSDGGLYGPKGAAVKNSRLYVTDTGGGRVVVFDPQGRQLLSVGSKGSGPQQLLEPVGITIGDGGEIIVADSANNRIQIFAADGAHLRSFPVPGWSEMNIKEAYLVMSEDGVFFLSDPLSRSIKQFSVTGGFIRSMDIGAESPTGIAIYGGRILVGDRTRGRILQLTLSGQVVQ